MKKEEIKIRVSSKNKEEFKKKCISEETTMSQKLTNFIINDIKNVRNDIKITVTVDESINDVSCEDLNKNYVGHIRVIDELNNTYISDEDFGRNVRKFLKVLYNG